MREIREGEDIEETEKTNIASKITPAEISEHIRKYDEFLQESKIENDEASSGAEFERTQREIREYIAAEEKSKKLMDDIISDVTENPLNADNLERDHIEVRGGSREILSHAPHIREIETKEDNESLEVSKVEKEDVNSETEDETQSIGPRSEIVHNESMETSINRTIREFEPTKNMIASLFQSIICDNILSNVIVNEYGTGHTSALDMQSMKYIRADLFLPLISESFNSMSDRKYTSLTDLISESNDLVEETSLSSLEAIKKLHHFAVSELTKPIQLSSFRNKDISTLLDHVVPIQPVNGLNSIIDWIFESVHSSITSEVSSIQEKKNTCEKKLHELLTLSRSKFSHNDTPPILLILVGPTLEPCLWSYQNGELSTIKSHSGSTTRNNLTLTSQSFERPFLFKLESSSDSVFNLTETYKMTDCIFNSLKSILNSKGCISLPTTWQWILDEGFLSPYSRDWGKSKRIIDEKRLEEGTYPTGEFLDASFLLGLFLTGDSLGGPTHLNFSSSIKPLIDDSESSIVRVSKTLYKNKGRLGESFEIPLPTQKGAVYWEQIESPSDFRVWDRPLSIDSGLRRMLIAFKDLTDEFPKSPLLNYSLIRTDDKQTIPEIISTFDTDTSMDFSASDVFASPITIWGTKLTEGGLGNLTERFFKVFYLSTLSIVSSEIERILTSDISHLRSRIRGAIGSGSLYYDKEIDSSYIICELLTKVISIAGVRHPESKSGGTSTSHNPWGGMGGEKLALDPSKESVRTMRILYLEEHERYLVLNECITRTDYEGKMIPYTPLDEFDSSGIRTHRLPLLVRFGARSLVNPELLWDIDSILLEHQNYDEISRLREMGEWDKFTLKTLEALSETFNHEPHKIASKIDPVRTSKLIKNYMMLAKESGFTIRNRYFNSKGFPITVNTSLFPYSLEHLTGALFPIFGSPLSGALLTDLALKLGMDSSQGTEIKALPYSFTVASASDRERESVISDDGNTLWETSADSRILLWIDRGEGSESDLRVVKLSYKVGSADGKPFTRSLPTRFVDDINIDNHIPVLQVYDYVEGTETGNTSITRQYRVIGGGDNLDSEKQKDIFYSKIALIQKRISSTLSVANMLGISPWEIMKNNLPYIDLLEKFAPTNVFLSWESAVQSSLSTNIRNLPYRLDLTGRLLTLQQQFFDMVSSNIIGKSS